MTARESLEGVIHGAGGGVYLVRTLGGEYVEAVLRGRVKRVRRTGEKVVIGDRVRVHPTDDSWVIETVADRDSEIVRRGPGNRTPKVIAANLDLPVVLNVWASWCIPCRSEAPLLARAAEEFSTKYLASRGTSSGRSRSGGSVKDTTLMR